jgi:dCMP deaminase|tara:strand:+ start:320 stop:781 length:462 start_codon:yes stop_codon:yes gene_type:complete
MKNKYIRAHLKVARIYGELSTADRLKVGCIIVKDDRIISIGYNGMPSGGSNVCEKDGESKPEVLHAEANAITKLAKSTESGQDSYMFCSYAPCLDCAKLILQSGIKEFHYEHRYKNNDGLDLLEKYTDIKILKYTEYVSKIMEKENDEAGNIG